MKRETSFGYLELTVNSKAYTMISSSYNQSLAIKLNKNKLADGKHNLAFGQIRESQFFTLPSFTYLKLGFILEVIEIEEIHSRFL